MKLDPNLRTRIRVIKAKARLASHVSRHDPEPQTPDVLQTIELRDITSTLRTDS